ncbi:serine/threonine-protein kinase [Saccharothrix sp. Mg75]|uniref:serine/threonine-protein kinase n=1 Tax=Saccharothrix sp. Mg75 TaxID=3445357 RepID=UPI003EEB7638
MSQLQDDLLAGRYKLAGALGFGGMAEVYRAWDTVLCRDVAVKLFQPNADLDDRRRFDNEARTLARLSHPGLVSVHDTGGSDRGAFLVLQLVDGRTLRHRIARGPLAVEEVRRLGARLSGALAYVHDRGVVHRDVKPSNILLDRAGEPYLADFGLAHLTGATRFTRTGQMVGTAAYLAPEQVRGTEVGPAADVYALGLVLLECLTGRREYPGGDVEAAVARLHRPPDVPRDLPADLVRLLTLMTSLSPRRRPTAHDCARALTGHTAPAIEVKPDDAHGRSAPTPPSVLRSPVKTPKKTLTAAAGLVGAVCIAWTMSSSTSPATSAPNGSAPQIPATTSSPSPTPSSTTAPVVGSTTGTSTGTPEVPGEQRTDDPVVQQSSAPAQQGRRQPEQVKEQPPNQAKDKDAGKDKKTKP